jgi:hypothetical protein
VESRRRVLPVLLAHGQRNCFFLGVGTSNPAQLISVFSLWVHLSYVRLKFCGSHGGETVRGTNLWGCDVVYCDGSLPRFRRNVLLPSLGWNSKINKETSKKLTISAEFFYETTRHHTRGDSMPNSCLFVL